MNRSTRYASDEIDEDNESEKVAGIDGLINSASIKLFLLASFWMINCSLSDVRFNCSESTRVADFFCDLCIQNVEKYNSDY